MTLCFEVAGSFLNQFWAKDLALCVCVCVVLYFVLAFLAEIMCFMCMLV